MVFRKLLWYGAKAQIQIILDARKDCFFSIVGDRIDRNCVQIFVCGFLGKLIFATIFIRFFGGNQRGINCEQGEIKLKRLNASCN